MNFSISTPELFVYAQISGPHCYRYCDHFLAHLRSKKVWAAEVGAMHSIFWLPGTSMNSRWEKIGALILPLGQSRAKREAGVWARWNECETEFLVACITPGLRTVIWPKNWKGIIWFQTTRDAQILCSRFLANGWPISAFEFSKIFLADTVLWNSVPSPSKNLATQLQGMWLSDNLQLLVPAESASAFELSWVFSGSPRAMAEPGDGIKA